MAFLVHRLEIKMFIILSVILIIFKGSMYKMNLSLYTDQASVGHVTNSASVSEENMTILIWSKYFREEFGTTLYAKFLNHLIQNMPCKDWCHVTGNRSYLNQTAALVWHGWRDDPVVLDVPGVRNPQQPWVWWALENPYYSAVDQISPLKGVFNWTMTYRLDSDVVYNYGSAVADNHTNSFKTHTVFHNNVSKPLVVAVVSKCKTHSKREAVIEALRAAGLDIDIYGKCGNKTTEGDTSIWQRIPLQYKFYLAFENSDCLDYITEKFWRALKLGLVPIVYGGRNYSRVAPPHSSINLKDFSNAQSLVEYIKYLSNTPRKYEKYLRWKQKFKITDGSTDGNGWCELCTKLKAKEHLNIVSIYDNITSWWTSSKKPGTPACLRDTDVSFWPELTKM